ncbi:MAG: glutamate synthase large subunit [Clostridiales bacterium]|nr:glutamate synthase large subunit [Clostridiales bacterium]
MQPKEKFGLYDPAFEHDSCGIGMVVNIKGRKSHKLVGDAVEVLSRLTHRGGAGAKADMGDGAGIMIQIPHAFFKKVCGGLPSRPLRDIPSDRGSGGFSRAHSPAAGEVSGGFSLPDEGGYGVAMLFLSPDKARRESSLKQFYETAAAEGLAVLGVRTVPVYPGALGEAALNACPSIRQVFIKKPANDDAAAFERALYVLSKVAYKAIRKPGRAGDPYFYVASLSSRTIVYKGLLTPEQLKYFYLDLADEDVASAIALVHSRFSTNTFPSWERAHPMRHIIHNGEINTIRANVNWVKAREAALAADFPNMRKIFPVINESGSDSAMLDDFVSLLTNTGYSFPEAMMLAIPEPWENDPDIDPDKRALYQYNSCLCEPWDGPAAIAFTDGTLAGAILDRNGLRPSRWCVTRDDVLILSSEAGVLPREEDKIVRKDRLRPGRMLLVDTAAGRIVEDGEIKRAAAGQRPYRAWVAENLKAIKDVKTADKPILFSALVEELKRSDNAADIAAAKQFLDSAQCTVHSPQLKDSPQCTVHSPQLMGSAQSTNSTQSSSDCKDTTTETVDCLSLITKQKLFGYTTEDVNLTIKGIVEKADDPVSSMGTDTPLAVLSSRPQLLFNYFKQLFAQVTNPPIDAIREKIVTSAKIQLGSESSLLDRRAENCAVVHHDTPVLTALEAGILKRADDAVLRAVVIPALFRADDAGGLEKALDTLFAAAETAIRKGKNLIVLSDADAGAGFLPIPSLLAVSGLHHRLVRAGTRTKVSIVIETNEAREVHHFAALVGFGANAVCPALVYQTLADLCARGSVSVPYEKAEKAYIATVTKSIVKIISKMGVSTIRSYHGAQVFEALGIGRTVIDRYFTGTPSRIGGAGLPEIEAETRARAAAAFQTGLNADALPTGGDYKWRKDGEYHLFNPENLYYLQQACRTGNYEMFKKFSDLVNSRSAQLKSLRSLLSIANADKPLPIDLIEPASSIVKRFKSGAMSYGSISREAHECIAVAMNRLGGKSNTGEGGEIPERFAVGADGLNRCSAIKQVASGRFGVTIHYLNNAKEIQIKMAQGAKPGEGGHLPGGKIYPWIAAARHSTPGVELISPPPHHDIYSIEDLAQLIHDLKNANRDARISVKLVSEAGVGTIAVGVAKGLADVIVVSGYDGGTGAAPRTSIRHAGLPWELGLAETHQSLMINRLRSRVTVETDGKLLTGRDVVIAALLGADEFAFATAPLIVLGCDMMRVCNLDTCPVGIATQNPALRARFTGKPEYVENFMLFVAEETREHMARIGARSFDELIGHGEYLRQRNRDFNPKAKTVDLSALLQQIYAPDGADERHACKKQDHRLEMSLDTRALLPLCKASIEDKTPTRARMPINNTNRTAGCILSSEIARRHGAGGLPEDTVQIDFDGSAGQSFGAFLAGGVTFRLNGEGNDYLGKGCSGGKIIVAPRENKRDKFEGDVIIGNVAFYGATSGEAYIRGAAGERFCVRNSGLNAVVEGVGDHGCEYMTGGRVVVLGAFGRNFAAGMSGGVAYVYNSAQCTVHSPQLEDNDNAQCNGHFSLGKPIIDCPSKENSPAKKEKSVGEVLSGCDAQLKDNAECAMQKAQIKGKTETVDCALCTVHCENTSQFSILNSQLNDNNAALKNINTALVNVSALDADDKKLIKEMLAKHKKYTGSKKATAVLKDFETEASKFVKIIPKDYQRIMEAMKEAEAQGLKGEDAALYAFEHRNTK